MTKGIQDFLHYTRVGWLDFFCPNIEACHHNHISHAAGIRTVIVTIIKYILSYYIILVLIVH